MVGVPWIDRHRERGVQEQSDISVEPRPAEITRTKEASIGAGIVCVSRGRKAQRQCGNRQRTDGGTDCKACVRHARALPSPGIAKSWTSCATAAYATSRRRLARFPPYARH